MRSSIVSVIALACAALTGCTSSSGIDSIMLQSKTSAETTSSVARPVPPAPLSEMVSAPQPMPVAEQEEVLAWAGPIPDAGPFKAEPPAPITPQPQPQERPQARISVPKPEVAAYPP